MSLVIGLSLRPDPMKFLVKARTFGFQKPFESSHSMSLSANRSRRKKRCLLSLNSGAVPHMLHLGSRRSFGSSVLPHSSHWSPPGVLEAAVRARAVDVPVWQEPLVHRAIR